MPSELTMSYSLTHQNNRGESHKHSLAISGIMALAGLILLVSASITAVSPEAPTVPAPQNESTTAL